MIERLDTWVGKTLFIPPIIKFCQLTNMGANRFANYAAWIGVLCFLYGTMTQDVWTWFDWFLIVGFGFISVVMTIRIGLFPDTEWRGSSMAIGRVLRVLFMVVILLAVVGVVTKGLSSLEWQHAYFVLALAADYAGMIDRIPPKRKRKKKATKKLVPVKVRN